MEGSVGTIHGPFVPTVVTVSATVKAIPNPDFYKMTTHDVDNSIEISVLSAQGKVTGAPFLKLHKYPACSFIVRFARLPSPSFWSPSSATWLCLGWQSPRLTFWRSSAPQTARSTTFSSLKRALISTPTGQSSLYLNCGVITCIVFDFAVRGPTIPTRTTC